MAASKKRRSQCCCKLAVVAILLMALFLLLLAFIEFKPKHPTTVLDSTSISRLRFRVDPFPSLHVRLNMTLHVRATVNNPNPVGFKYSDSAAYLRYRGNEVGSTPIPAGEVGGNSEKKMNLTMTVMLDRLLGDSKLYSDVISGSLPLQTHVSLPGKVRVLVGVGVVTYTTCDFVVDLKGQDVDSQTCRYSAKVGWA